MVLLGELGEKVRSGMEVSSELLHQTPFHHEELSWVTKKREPLKERVSHPSLW